MTESAYIVCLSTCVRIQMVLKMSLGNKMLFAAAVASEEATFIRCVIVVVENRIFVITRRIRRLIGRRGLIRWKLFYLGNGDQKTESWKGPSGFHQMF